MRRYLVVDFDRYDTEDSTYEFVEANSHFDALLKVMGEGEELDEEELYFLKGNFKQVDETFGCLSGEENDILVYLVGVYMKV